MTTIERDATMPDHEPTLQEVTAFVTHNRVPVDNKARRCVDGGYMIGQSEGSIALPGADLELVELLLTLKKPDNTNLFTVDEAFDLVFEFSQNHGGFFWHTDTHALDLDKLPDSQRGELPDHHEHDADAPACGCGHFNAGMKYGERVYGIAASRLTEMHQLVLRKQQEHDDDGQMQCVVLDRKHQERAIIVVTGTTHTVRPWGINPATNQQEQFFVYDRSRFEVYLQQFVEFLSTKGHSGINYDLLHAIFMNELMGTLGLLDSSRGKVMFEVNVDDIDNIQAARSATIAPNESPPFTADTIVR